MSLGVRLRELYKGYRPFSDEVSVISTVKSAKAFDAEREDISKAKKVQLLSTLKQRTYLVSTGKRIYKILDDRRLKRPKVVWSRRVDELFKDHNLEATLVSRNEDIFNLVINAAPDKRNLVSKDLFANIDFNEAVARLGSAG
uniref:Uncharacterized protein n=1 Tax=Candidatus Kentrum sp. MB TaxID=2138164 RepID=A0A450XR90_9GAMM|nr:MAG: hypothetical protein BECKMB1821G_GA0114241_103128 [Candidatus Kentron sp. MB]VFK31789.1 MAG: hypothetical protein BECKMB1821I_GA0114274_10277 [Candidatus Kentron sp. MB]VFK75564.1 MAG: hypothetical protein BECKMB1821H_GA0114242_10267 [Candidatus Kentron sp. MB]